MSFDRRYEREFLRNTQHEMRKENDGKGGLKKKKESCVPRAVNILWLWVSLYVYFRQVSMLG